MPLLATAPFDFDAHRWKHRILVVSGAPGNAKIAAVRRIARAYTKGFRERDLLVVEIGEDPKVRARFGLGAGFSEALIGKDGGVKLRRKKPIQAAELFGIIDAMPMRREEMAGRAR